MGIDYDLKTKLNEAFGPFGNDRNRLSDLRITPSALYDAIPYPPEGITEMVFFSKAVSGADHGYRDTNMQQAGVLPSNRAMEVREIRFYWHGWSARHMPMGELDSLIEDAWCQMRVGDRLEYDNNIKPLITPIPPFLTPPIFIPPMWTFYLYVRWRFRVRASIGLFRAAHDLRLMASFVGTEYMSTV